LQNGDREDVRAQVVRHVGVGMSAKQRLHALCAAPLSHQGEEKLLVRRAAMLKQTSKRSHVVVFSRGPECFPHVKEGLVVVTARPAELVQSDLGRKFGRVRVRAFA